MEFNSLQQWFQMCDEQSEAVKEYEDTIDKFYDKLLGKSEIAYRDNTFNKPFMKGFYKKEMSRFGKRIPSIILSKLLMSIICAVVAFLLVTIIPAVKALITNGNRVVDFMIAFKGKLIIGIIVAVLVLILIPVLAIILKKSSLKSICATLEKQETKLTPMLTTVPARCRSFERMDTLAKIFYSHPDVTFDQAIDVCDEVCRQNKNRLIMSVMFDLPFSNNLSDRSSDARISSDEEEETAENKETSKKIPNLPADIETKVAPGSEDAERDLASMIGLESVKDQITKFKNRIQFYGSSEVGGGGNHMVFMGSAGTGKTTVARIITKMLYDFGFITRNVCVEVSGDYLKSPYTGQTGERTAAIVEYSMGGVLFIDEAYLLYDNSSASQEATGVLLKAMEDRRKDFVVILAGYEEQITKLLASNEGFNSRIKYKIYFPDYEVEEMYQIFVTFINHYNNNQVYLVEDSAKDLLLKTFALEKKSKSFGNARTVRNAVDTVMDNYADRCIRENTKEAVIKLEDVEMYAKSRENELQHEVRNTSAANQLDESIIRLSELKQKVLPGSDNPDADMNQMVGLESFRKEIELLKNQKQFYGKDFNAKQQNILLLGQSGCGKSSLVKILTGYLHQFGYIQDNRYLSISAEFLKGSYVGHTSRRADAIINYAAGGVLFIKNFNILTQDNTDSFSQEAVSAIVTALNGNNNIVIVIADYPSNYLNSMKNMFSIIYEFPQYNASQLVQIFNIKANTDGFNVRQETFNLLYNYLLANTNLAVRDLIRIYDNAKKNHINNYNGGDNKFIIEPQDLGLQMPQQQTQGQNNTQGTTSTPATGNPTTKLKLNIKRG